MKMKKITRSNFLVTSTMALGTFMLPSGARKNNNQSFNVSSGIPSGKRDIDIPTIDISHEKNRHVMIAQGTEEIRQGHPSTLLLPDGKIMFVAWSYGHGGPVGPLKKSVDGGQTWSGLVEVPDNWLKYSNCPSLYRLKDPKGRERLFVFANNGPRGQCMYRAVSEDGGNTWTSMAAVKLADGTGILSENSMPPTVMPFTAITQVDDGNALLGVSNLRRVGEYGKTNVVAQSRSTDGGLTWDYWRIILDLGSPYMPCEPEVIRSPDGRQLLMLIRENVRSMNSWIMISNNEGRTWSEPFQATASVTMDRHQAVYAPDGRLVIVGRDVAEKSPSKGHFVGWVGSYEDLVDGKEGEYRVKLLHTYKTTEYPGLELLPDGTFVATNSVAYRPGENHSVVSTRFSLNELDNLL